MTNHGLGERTCHGKAQLMLRRNLALWKPQRTIEDTVAFCQGAAISEVIWKIDAEDFNHGYTSHRLIDEYLVWLAKAKTRLNEIGVAFSINPWLTLGHVDRCRYPDGPPAGFHWRVQPEGDELKAMACPLSPGWRNWFLGAYRLYAQLHPAKLWIEDDFKTFGHRSWGLGCYCDVHLAEFATQTGEELNRAELVSRITACGEPHPLRAKWFDFQGRIMVELCEEVVAVVHGVSPETRLGLMCSWSTDGRWWEQAVRVLAGPHRPLARSSLAAYQEGRAYEMAPDQCDILKETACLPADVENCPELENSTYGPYSKSARVTRLQVAMSQLLGHRALTMNLFDMTGGDTAEDPRLHAMLREVKPKLDAIAALLEGQRVPRGIAIPFDRRYADSVHVPPGKGFEAFRFDGDGWCLPVQASGMPVVFNGTGRVAAITGQSIRGMSRQRIENLLRHGLLLDGSAAAVLSEMGYGHHLGVSLEPSVGRYELLLSAERDDGAPARADNDPIYMTLRALSAAGPGRLYRMALDDGAKAISTCVDPDHRAVMPGCVIFENAMGGRTAVFPFDLSGGMHTAFMNWHRKKQIQRVIRWLGRDRVDLQVDGGAWMTPLRWDFENRIVIGILNLETDPWEEVNLTFDTSLESSIMRIQQLNPTGDLVDIQPRKLVTCGSQMTAVFSVSVAALDFAVIVIR